MIGPKTADGEDMKKWAVCWIPAFGGFLIASLAIGLAIHGWPWPTGPSAESPMITDWLTAIGTISATFAAVGIAAGTEFRLRAENRRKAVVLKWIFARWSGSVSTGSSLLKQKLRDLASTPAGQRFDARDVHLVGLAMKMIDPQLMLGYTDRLHILGKDSADYANMISLAWALSGHLAEIYPSLNVAPPDMTILRTCADQAEG